MTIAHVEPLAAREPFGRFALKFAKTLATGFLPGLISGFFAFGLGSRLAMRVMAATSGPAAQGLTTEADEIVGKITLGGSLFLILAGTFIGGVAGLIYLATKPWLPTQRWKRSAIFSLLMLALVGRVLVDSDNLDFVILSPSALAVAMFSALPLLYGAIFVVLYDRLAPFIWKARPMWATIALLIPCMLPLLVGGAFSLVLVPVALLVGWAASGSSALTDSRTVQMVARVLLGGVVVVGITFLAISIVQILYGTGVSV